jgi:hypothetical protein
VKVIGRDKREYSIEYLLPARLEPWPHAYVRGEAHSEDEAVEMIVTAMARSEGWPPGIEGHAPGATDVAAR